MPPTIEDVIKALKEADRLGNTEDARKLATIADRMRKEKQSEASFFQSMAKGIEQTPAGLPALLARKMGLIEELPEGKSSKLAEYTGRGVGEVSSYLIPMGLLARSLSAGTGMVANIAKNVLDTMGRHPRLTVASEIGGGIGMGAGEYVGEEIAPEAKVVGGMIGGITGSMAPAAIKYSPVGLGLRHGGRLLKKLTMPLTEGGIKYRAGEFLKKQVVSPDIAAEKVVSETLGELLPVVASGEKRLMQIHKQIISKDPVLESDALENLSKSFFKLEGEMRKFGYGAPETLKEIVQKRINSIQASMDNRILAAMKNAQDKLNSIPLAKRKIEESRIVREEIESLMRSENERIGKLWKDVPKELMVDSTKTKNIYKEIVNDLANAQKTDIPFSLKGSPIITGEETTTTLKEMQGLRSKLLEEARFARANGKWNKARIAEDVSDAILSDLDESPDIALRPALEGTRRFKERFERGIVGKILGYSKTGAPAISPELTLDISIGRMGTRGSIDIEKIAISPEAIEATKRYLSRSFTDYALDKNTGILNSLKSEKWIRNNEAIIDKFPDLKKLMIDAENAQKLATNTMTLMEARKKSLQNPKISIASKFLNTDIGKEVDAIFKSKDPVRESYELIKMARKDQTGNAIEGLRGSFVDYILDKSAIGKYNELGERTLSGNTMISMIQKNDRVLRRVFSSEQISRMHRIAKELTLMENYEIQKEFKGEFQISDWASNLLRLASRVGGAQIGRIVAKMTGGGTVQTPGIFSQRLKNVAENLTKDGASQLISDAITSRDGKLLQTLLLPIDKPSQYIDNMKKINRKLNAWLVGEGRRVWEDYIKEENELKKGKKP